MSCLDKRTHATTTNKKRTKTAKICKLFCVCVSVAENDGFGRGGGDGSVDTFVVVGGVVWREGQ